MSRAATWTQPPSSRCAACYAPLTTGGSRYRARPRAYCSKSCGVIGRKLARGTPPSPQLLKLRALHERLAARPCEHVGTLLHWLGDGTYGCACGARVRFEGVAAREVDALRAGVPA